MRNPLLLVVCFALAPCDVATLLADKPEKSSDFAIRVDQVSKNADGTLTVEFSLQNVSESDALVIPDLQDGDWELKSESVIALSGFPEPEKRSLLYQVLRPIPPDAKVLIGGRGQFVYRIPHTFQIDRETSVSILEDLGGGREAKLVIAVTIHRLDVTPPRFSKVREDIEHTEFFDSSRIIPVARTTP
jgi:hypothetical protein